MQLRSELDDQSEKLQQSAEQNVLSAKQHVQVLQSYGAGLVYFSDSTRLAKASR